MIYLNLIGKCIECVYLKIVVEYLMRGVFLGFVSIFKRLFLFVDIWVVNLNVVLMWNNYRIVI